MSQEGSAVRRGALVYLMGASGSGKDSVLRWLGAQWQESDRIVAAHRYLTRESDANEAGVTLSDAEFERRMQLGFFAMHWRSHDVYYGVGIELDAWRAAGLTVIVNGSRDYLPQACARYPDLYAIELTVDPEVLAARLRQRGRESGAAIAARLARGAQQFAVPDGCRVVRLRNDGALEDAGEAIQGLIRGLP
ncbi:phosphonate metabolism protein/1,5-bisphosphokinase (PRPP-forming) PhnN [Robbsia sp. KACC 23696]|uniref:phosphonate metabolism protein/1,5-bisphosphokinase (PRPP-forming) PhnN n=1 Tax=Robbsia sp. KACC 23696 TaxID=3149231 RepID=UPI00325B2090